MTEQDEPFGVAAAIESTKSADTTNAQAPSIDDSSFADEAWDAITEPDAMLDEDFGALPEGNPAPQTSEELPAAMDEPTPVEPAAAAAKDEPAVMVADEQAEIVPVEDVAPVEAAETAEVAESDTDTEEDPFERVPAPLATAMRNRGFTELTSVQVSALEAMNDNRDLRITSQTGSGKTVALGLVMASELIAAAENQNWQDRPVGPTALVIAPTRELAMQLSQELWWLFNEVGGMTVLCVTGGKNLVQERKRLARMPRILVGTPGRLLDHIRSGALDCSGVKQLVLDEADQMLDMGFRDELEAIVETTPKERRTHLVSATFADGIRRMAERYQSDALHIEGTAMGAANEDIEHVVHMVHDNERYDALVNLLLLAEDKRTLVFVDTRVGTSELSERLAEDGFSAMPLSGELAQAQRTRTLSAFRSGTVKALIATDVAARGLDVPDVGQVIHMTPPLDGEVYTHRSGRTGRAGRKGRSVLLVAMSKQRRVKRLFWSTGIEMKYLDLPDRAAVERELDKRAEGRIIEAIDAEGAAEAEHLDAAGRLLEGRDANTVVAQLLARVAQERPTHARDISVPSQQRRGGGNPRWEQPQQRGNWGNRQREDNGPRYGGGRDAGYQNGGGGGSGRGRDLAGAKPFERSGSYQRGGGHERFFVNWGFRGGASPQRLLALICRRGDMTSQHIGHIDLGPHGSTFEVSAAISSEFEAKAGRHDSRDPSLRIVRAWENNAGEGGPRQHDQR